MIFHSKLNERYNRYSKAYYFWYWFISNDFGEYFVDACFHQNDPKDLISTFIIRLVKNQLLSELNDPGAEFYFYIMKIR